MNEKNTQYLVSTYAPLYEYCPVFECNDGWFKIIDDMSAEIHYIILKTKCSCRVAQIKEKYGTLRVYMDTSLDEIDKIIDKAEGLSGKTCEICGEAGQLRGNTWFSTYCDDCMEK